MFHNINGAANENVVYENGGNGNDFTRRLALEGTSENFQYFSNLGGTACGVSRPTLCSPASMVYKPDAASITVQVALALSCPLAVSV